MMRKPAKSVLVVAVLALGVPLPGAATAFAAERVVTPPYPFFASAPDPSTGLDPQGIYPRGRRMPLGVMFGFGGGDMDRLRDGGFTMAGPLNGAHETWASQIDLAAGRGLGFAYQLEIPGLDFVNDPPATLDEAAIRAEVSEQVNAIVDNPLRDATVAYWSIYPDELRSWVPIEMEFLELATDAIRDAERARGRTPRPIWSYEPSNRETSNLVVTGRHLDLVAKAAYMNILRGADAQLSRAWVRWSIEQAAAASQLLDGRPPLAVLDVDFGATDHDDTAAIRRTTRHDAYLSLVSGAKGFLVYALPYAHSLVFDGYASVAKDMTGELGLGRVVLFGERRHDLRVRVTGGPRTVTVKANPNGPSVDTVYPSVAFLDVAYGTSRYLIAVNSAEERVDVRIEGLPTTPVLIDDLFADGGKQRIAVGGSFSTSLGPLGAGAFRFEPPAAL